MDGKSKDLTQEYIAQLAQMFPEVVTEVADSNGDNVTRKVDMEKLALLLGEMALPTDDIDYRNQYGEKFSFEWAGKRRAIAEAQKRSTGTLRPCVEDSVDWDTTENIYIEGDNLEVLKLLQNSYLGKIKMIYIDPPYNTG
ncbi:MAG: site-specific DNA-methyltransferase, partial [Rikenellaceae bacterium]